VKVLSANEYRQRERATARERAGESEGLLGLDWKLSHPNARGKRIPAPRTSDRE